MQIKPKVELLTYTPEPDKLVAAAAKLCYARSDIDTLLDNLTPEKVADFLQRLEDMGHESPIEHVSFTFGIEGVSRSLLAQITRHRIASFSVQSQRYVDKSDFDYIIPPAVEQDPEALAEFLAAMDEIGRHYDSLRAKLKESQKARLMAEGMNEKDADYKAGKMANEDARFVLPNACDTRIVMTMNARSLHNFFRLRCCNRAQWEIRALADEMLRLCREVSPLLFAKAGPACVTTGRCSEGAMSCGRPRNELKL